VIAFHLEAAILRDEAAIVRHFSRVSRGSPSVFGDVQRGAEGDHIAVDGDGEWRVMRFAVGARPQGSTTAHSSKQIFWLVRGQTSAQVQSRRAKLTVAPRRNVPLPCTHTASKKAAWTDADRCCSSRSSSETLAPLAVGLARKVVVGVAKGAERAAAAPSASKPGERRERFRRGRPRQALGV
jgi:hypothetical protein